MILWLINHLSISWGWKIPAAFQYVSTRMVLATITSLLITLALGPFFIRTLYALKIGQTIRTEECPLLGALHRNKSNTPTMGGLLILASMIISSLLWMQIDDIFTWLLLFVLVSLGFLGGWDDYLKLKYKNTKGLSARKKLFFQMLISSVIACYFLIPTLGEKIEDWTHLKAPVIKEEKKGEMPQALTLQDYISRLYVPFVKQPIAYMPHLLVGLWIFLVMAGTSNAVNLTDGLDGLASGCIIMVSVVYSLIAFVSNHTELASYLNLLYIEGSGDVAVFLCTLTGACLGFLWFNGHPAQVFMGDTGSLSIGGVLGLSALLLKKEVLLIIVGGIFVVEALSVIIQVTSFRFRQKKRVFLCTPIHHHFEYKGWPETKVVLRFWIVALLLSFIGLASLKLQ